MLLLSTTRCRGHLSQVNTPVSLLQLPEVGDAEGNEAPASIDARFQFESSGAYRLQVKGADQALPGAVVDIELINDLRRSDRTFLGSFKTDSSGRLELKGSDANLYRVYAYSEGFEPRVAMWTPGLTLELNLRPYDAELTLEGTLNNGYVRVKPAGQAFPVATLRTYGLEAEPVAVAPGMYDLTVFEEQGALVRSIRAKALSRQSQAVSLQEDHRPSVRVVLPLNEAADADWSVWATRSTPMVMPAAWAAYTTYDGGQLSIQEPVAEMESQEAGEVVLRLSTPGTVQIVCAREALPHLLLREVTLAPGEDRTLTIPPLTSSLKGSMKTYHGGKGFSHHGWAGPRLIMLADEEEGWSVIVNLPKREANDSFEISSVLAGDFHVYQHLIGEPAAHAEVVHEGAGSNRPSDAWGGIPVRLLPNQATALKDFDEYARGLLRVFIRDWNGLPLDGATLSVRDRMSEAWRQVKNSASSLANADDPIPYPPAVRVAGGVAELPSIRAGRLELRLVVDDGRAFDMARDIDPEKRLEIRLPR